MTITRKMNFVSGIAVVALALSALDGLSGETVDLNGAWDLKAFPQPDDGAVRSLPLPAGLEAKTYAATVPGCCEMELVKAGELADPLVGFNAFEFRDYEGHQWLYSRRFAAPKRAPGERCVLVFDGIDTLADVFLNGEKIVEAKDGRTVHEGDFTVGANGLAELSKLTWDGQGLFRIEYVVGNETFKTHYLHGEPPFAWTDYRAWTKDLIN